MLNSETKQKIQNLRDTLVGKIPTPTGQVTQTKNLNNNRINVIIKENLKCSHLFK